MFAEDTCIVKVENCLNQLVARVNEMLARVYDWCLFNRLSINPRKSEFLLVSNRKCEIDPLINIGTEIISRKTSVKYLGIHVDESLKFHTHIDHLKSKLQQYAGITYRLHRYFNDSAAKNLYYSCVFSAVKYCICVWGGVLQCTTRGAPLVRLHDRII